MKSWNEIRKAATAFSKRWKDAYDEKSQAQSFLKNCAAKAIACIPLITMSGCFSMVESGLGRVDGGSGKVSPSTMVIDAVTLPAQVVFLALLQIVDTSLPCVAATRPNTALALWRRARPAGHPAARIAA